ncbi:histone deacetylase 4-like isoform X2 [Paramacrobiotus metropolitanus]|nr:histone deacetylase 4-like isoform X2 [Paramacrobiotus metropolitanus]XP_055348340.1 histone deacetylase 4-like isoform X2 [Paramacrobiotus metropolitanus]XP_055348342.1 histone deacetylase 4-like isoform X2 [Paramacrobiotus metropolitanus]XP_055348343.1 histone deacetylase 4-like isoform X2 [Paramacrobiotus metropolitanus]
MEVNSHFRQASPKEGGKPSAGGECETEDMIVPVNGEHGAQANNPEFHQQLYFLKQQQQIQQHLLYQQFQQQQQQLVAQHNKQLEEHMRVYFHHRQRLDEQERAEREKQEADRLEALRHKEKHEQSAVASSEVKQRLHEFVLQKKQRESMTNGGYQNATSPINNTASRDWSTLDNAAAAQPQPPPQMPPAMVHRVVREDFPLRKTASEPNLKIRSALKQRVLERRVSPLMKPIDKLLTSSAHAAAAAAAAASASRRNSHNPNGSSSNSDSGPDSPGAPASSTGVPSHHGSLSSLTGGELPAQPVAPFRFPLSSIQDLSFFPGSTPSLASITQGRPMLNGTASDLLNGEVQLRLAAAAAAAARLSLPGYGVFNLPGMLPPILDNEALQTTTSNSNSPSDIHHQMKILEQQAAHAFIPGVYVPRGHGALTDAQVAQARLNRTTPRPLSRTHSAPLPLGHPLLQAQSLLLQQPEYKQLLEQHQHQLLKQHIRQTVLSRASSKNQVAEMAEEPDESAGEAMDQGLLNGDTKGPGSSTIQPVQQQQQQQEVVDLSCKDEDRLGDLKRDSKGELIREHHSRRHSPRPLGRAFSSPLVLNAITRQATPPRPGCATGVVYDSVMLKHQCICGDNSLHPEHSGRLQSIFARLQETGLLNRCERLRSRKATLEEIQTCHSEAYTMLFGSNPTNRSRLDPNKLCELPLKSFVLLPCGGVGVDSDTTWNELHTASAARMAVGCVIELVFRIATGEIKNGFAIVRPPGHHAEHQLAMGFCFFNSIAIATKLARHRLHIQRILIVDFDVHHGNGTQQMFYSDPNVLYMSIHRHDKGNFFPGTGGPEEVGTDAGTGFNVNVAFSGGLVPGMTDVEYLAAFRTVIMPIAEEFSPDLVMVSAGFDAAAGHPPPLGGYQVSPACFGQITRLLGTLAGGKVAMVLEGGYDLAAICDSAEECVKALLGDPAPPIREEVLVSKPNVNCVESLEEVIRIQMRFWPCLKRTAGTVGWSLLEAQQRERAMQSQPEPPTGAMASLSVAAIVGSTTREEEPMDQDK